MAYDALDWWLKNARKGDSLVYHRGHSLAADRLHNPRLHKLADRLDRLSTIGRRVEMSECYHPRYGYDGAGLVSLTTKREHPESSTYIYLARKL